MTFAEAVDLVAHHSTTEQGRRMSVDDIAARIGRPANYLRKATSQYDDAHPLRGDLIVPMTMATRNYAIVEHIAEQCGGVFFQMPHVDAANLDVIEHAGTAVREFGDVLAASARALADGRVTPEEAADFRNQGNEAIAAIAKFMQLIDSKAVVAGPRAVERRA